MFIDFIKSGVLDLLLVQVWIFFSVDLFLCLQFE